MNADIDNADIYDVIHRRRDVRAQFTGARNARVSQVAIQGVEVQPFQRCSHRTCLPSRISGEQVPYVFGAVDGGHIQVALA